MVYVIFKLFLYQHLNVFIFFKVTEEMTSSEKKKMYYLVKAGKSAEHDDMQTIHFSILT